MSQNHRNKRYSGNAKSSRTPGEVLKACRKARRMSQEELEWKSGISRIQIGRIERDVSIPSYETIEKLESALDMPLFDVFNERKEQLEKAKKNHQMKTKNQLGMIKSFIKELSAKKLSDDELEAVLQTALSAADALKNKE